MAVANALAPDLILTNAQLLPMDGTEPRPGAVAIKGDRILAVGAADEVADLAGPRTEQLDLGGRSLLPGLADIHVHLASDAGRSLAVEVRDFYDPAIRSTRDIQARIRERAAQTPPGQWVVGRGAPLQDYRLLEERLPTRAELDEAAPSHPAYVTFGAHVIIANTLALQARGITRDTPDPQGGVVVKDPESGEPTGMLRERAQLLLRAREPDEGGDVLAENILRELQRCAARGVTQVHDIVVNRSEVLAYQQLAREGRLPVRVQLLVRVIEASFNKESLLDLGFVQGFGSDWLRLGGIKMSIDGGFTGKNAAFSDPLVHDGEEQPGLIRIQQDELDDTVARYHQAGMRCCIHAIGDVAMDMALDALEKATVSAPRRGARHRVEHLGNWMITPERLERITRLGILPIPNPSFLFFMGGEVVDLLGPKRTAHGFPFRTLMQAGIPLSFGSDAPGYYPVDPLRDLGAAHSRGGVYGPRLAPEESLSVMQALWTQTVGAAHAGFQEHQLGTLRPGGLADLVVFEEDPLRFPTERYRELPIHLTMTGGRIVYSAAQDGPAVDTTVGELPEGEVGCVCPY
jgi:predicted amidohydrolase YtcJ